MSWITSSNAQIIRVPYEKCNGIENLKYAVQKNEIDKNSRKDCLIVRYVEPLEPPYARMDRSGGSVGRVFALHAGDRGWIPDRHRPQSLKQLRAGHLHFQTLDNKCEYHVSSEMNIVKCRSVSQ